MNERTEKWLREARRYAYFLYCHSELIDEHPELVAAAVSDGKDVYEFVEWLGDKYDLDRVDRNWGLHDGAKFEKAALS